MPRIRVVHKTALGETTKLHETKKTGVWHWLKRPMTLIARRKFIFTSRHQFFLNSEHKMLKVRYDRDVREKTVSMSWNASEGMPIRSVRDEMAVDKKNNLDQYNNLLGSSGSENSSVRERKHGNNCNVLWRYWHFLKKRSWALLWQEKMAL